MDLCELAFAILRLHELAREVLVGIVGCDVFVADCHEALVILSGLGVADDLVAGDALRGVLGVDATLNEVLAFLVQVRFKVDGLNHSAIGLLREAQLVGFVETARFGVLVVFASIIWLLASVVADFLHTLALAIRDATPVVCLASVGFLLLEEVEFGPVSLGDVLKALDSFAALTIDLQHKFFAFAFISDHLCCTTSFLVQRFATIFAVFVALRDVNGLEERHITVAVNPLGQLLPFDLLQDILRTSVSTGQHGVATEFLALREISFLVFSLCVQVDRAVKLGEVLTDAGVVLVSIHPRAKLLGEVRALALR
jgi:hypothetical protein